MGDLIRIARYPQGKRFAVTFVDDTDLSTRENTEPVYEFLADQGFWGTKTVWPLRALRSSAFREDLEVSSPEEGAGSTLEDPNYLQFIQLLRDRGFEIALHGMAAGNSRRAEIEAGLARFEALIDRAPLLNAFHRTNLENLYCGAHKLDSRVFRLLERLSDRSDYQGHVPGSPSFWGDIVESRLRYVRLPFHTIDEINTLRVNPSMPFRDARRPYVREWFAASDGGDVVRFNRLLSARNVDRLEQEEGVSVVYTHFAKGFAGERRGRYQLSDSFASTVRALARRPGVWFATATALLDRLAGVRAVALSHEGLEVRIEYRGDRPLEGLVLVGRGGLELMDGQGIPLQKVGQDGSVAPPLQPGATLVLRASREGRQVIEPRRWVNISAREHRRIEYFNYLGLMRGALRDRLHYRQQRASAVRNGGGNG